MKRGRGRPRGSTDALHDIPLVWFVRNARDRGATVKEAVIELLKLEGRVCAPEDPLVESRIVRYHRAASAYPDVLVDWAPPDLPFAIFGSKRKTRSLLGSALLTVRPTRTPSKY